MRIRDKTDAMAWAFVLALLGAGAGLVYVGWNFVRWLYGWLRALLTLA